VIHFILGTRAQLIKTAPLMVECIERGIPYRFIYLAQHRETMVEMMDAFNIRRPDAIIGDFGSDITRSGTLVRWALEILRSGLKNRRDLFPAANGGIAVVHGDALPVLLGAVMAKSAGLKVAHVEAGLRSFNFAHPFPEELIRVLVWELGLVDYYFCPNEWAMSNVSKYRGQKHNTLHNTLYDSLRLALKADSAGADKLNIPSEKYAVVSIHRFETIARKDRLKEVVDVIIKMSARIPILFVLHPPTKVALKESGFYERLNATPNVYFRPRYKYHDFVKILDGSEFVVTDGGSNQEECYYLGHPCLLLRHVTERKEGLGENVFISSFDLTIINEFIDNYHKFKHHRFDADSSPSKLIISTLQDQVLNSSPFLNPIREG
jgi:UDP-N-acetylglucosamine 2-epimerase (non-hydrolysing)